jgi:cytochrome c oxidase cbb3-type subunit 3
MARRERDQLIEGHDVDGIREYDNPLPRWWLYLFYATIVFSVVYWVYYHMGAGGQSIADSYAAEMRERQAQEKALPKAEATEEALLASYRDAAQVAEGKKLYDGRCLACHGDKGQGLVGPNLTDDHWIHGQGTLAGMFKVIRDGVPEKGMIPWGAQLSREQMMQLVAFIATLHGTTPAAAKAPQGDRVAKPSWK